MSYGGARKHNHVVQLRSDSAFRSGAAGGLYRDARGLSYLIGSYPEHQTDHRAAFDPSALIGG